MNNDVLINRFNKNESIFFCITIAIMLITGLLLLYSLTMVKSVIAVPAVIVELSTYFLYFNVGYFVFGIGRIIYFFSKIRPNSKESTIRRSIFAVLITPVNVIVIYFSILFMALTSCVA